MIEQNLAKIPSKRGKVYDYIFVGVISEGGKPVDSFDLKSFFRGSNCVGTLIFLFLRGKIHREQVHGVRLLNGMAISYCTI